MDSSPDDTEKIYGPEDLMNVQMTFIDAISAQTCQQVENHMKCVDLAEKLFAEHANLKSRFAEEFREFMDKTDKKLAKEVRKIDEKAEKFGKGLKEVVELYVDVNDMMKDQQKKAKKQDAFVAQARKNVAQFKETMANVEKLKQQMASVVPPVQSTTSLSSSTISEGFTPANTIEKPFKPIETEVVTHISRILKEISKLREQLPMCKKLTEPIVKESKLVAQKVLKQFPAKSTQAYMDTLQPKDRC